MLKYIFRLKKTPAELVKIRKINESDNDGDLMNGIIKQYKRMNDPVYANKVLKEELSGLNEAKRIESLEQQK